MLRAALGFILFAVSFSVLEAQSSGHALEKNLNVILSGNDQGSQRIVQLGFEGLIPILFNPRNVENLEASEQVWKRFSFWLDSNASRLSYETLTTMELGLIAAMEGLESVKAYRKTAWKPAVLWGILLGSAFEMTAFRWARKITHRIAVRWRWALREGGCCRSKILRLMKVGSLAKFSSRHPVITNKILVSAATTLGFYFFFKDKEPGDLEIYWAEQQILPKIERLKKSSPRREEP